MITAHHLVFGRKYQGSLNFQLIAEIDGVTSLLPLVKNGTVTNTTDRKGGNTAIQFGSGNIVTPILPASSIWSVSFWIKTTNTSIGVLAELSDSFNYKNAFLIDISDTSSLLGKIMAGISSAGTNNLKYTNDIINDGNWNHIVIIFDRSQIVSNEIKIYINNSLKTNLTYFNGNTEQNGDFISNKIFIGGRGNTYSLRYNGLMADFKLFNRPLTQPEITNLYNE